MMTLQEATDFFENLATKTIDRSEKAVYERFSQIITRLRKKEFSKNEVQSIERELDGLDLQSNPKNPKQFFRKALTRFEYFLKRTFSFVSEGYYSNLGTGLGLTFGILLGIVFLSGLERSLGIALGISIGMLIGIIVGRSMESKAASAGRIF